MILLLVLSGGESEKSGTVPDIAEVEENKETDSSTAMPDGKSEAEPVDKNTENLPEASDSSAGSSESEKTAEKNEMPQTEVVSENTSVDDSSKATPEKNTPELNDQLTESVKIPEQTDVPDEPEEIVSETPEEKVEENVKEPEQVFYDEYVPVAGKENTGDVKNGVVDWANSEVSSKASLMTYIRPDFSRPEYVETAQNILNWRNVNQSNDKNLEFMQKVDQAWSLLCRPETEKEYNLLSEIMLRYYGIDELQRCKTARDSLREIHLKAVADAKAVFDEQQNQDVKAAAERQRQLDEAAQMAKENARLAQETAVLAKKRENVLKKEADEILYECLPAMVDSAITGDPSGFDAAMKKAGLYVANIKTFTPGEAKVVKDLEVLLASLPTEYNKLRAVFDQILKIKNFRILLARGSVQITEIRSGTLIGQGKQELSYKELVPRSRQTLFIVLKDKKISNPEFYSDMFHRKTPDKSVIPDGFWKKVWPYLEGRL
ncbi:MAG: hypothetical protein E7050_11975 [Lentisphaerae bacterium]|nr:hypothetical protein [Lentisphaerota bacterium]